MKAARGGSEKDDNKEKFYLGFSNAKVCCCNRDLHFRPISHRSKCILITLTYSKDSIFVFFLTTLVSAISGYTED